MSNQTCLNKYEKSLPSTSEDTERFVKVLLTHNLKQITKEPKITIHGKKKQEISYIIKLNKGTIGNGKFFNQ